jgi:hypothetical protein
MKKRNRAGGDPMHPTLRKAHEGVATPRHPLAARCSRALLLIALALVATGGTCSDPTPSKLLLDANYDPGDPSDAFDGTSEASPAVAQTFTVLQEGRLEQFEVLLTQGTSADTGTIYVEIRSTDATGAPELDPNTALVSIEVDTATLPATLVEEFTLFDISDLASIQVQPGEIYAIVVEFDSRGTNTDGLPIALVLGMAGDPYIDGDGYTGESNVAFMDSVKDYIFATWVRVKG